MMEKDIEERVLTAHQNESLADMRFHLMHINYWTTREDGIAIPAEIALLEMSLRDGIKEKFCQTIHPGVVPLGHKGEMKKRSDKYHCIWLDNDELSDSYLESKSLAILI